MSNNDHFNIFEELQKWSKTLENWECLSLVQLAQKGEVEEEDIEKIYKEFKIDTGLLKSSGGRKVYRLDESFIPQEPEEEKALVLKEICNVKGVNAIVEGQKLNFGPRLTVIYGPNGSGKSGYARILKSACFTRSKDITIYGNVHVQADERCPASALFMFDDSTSVSFLQGTPCRQLMDNFAVFDSSCVRVYTDTKTDFNVSPYGFEIFTGLISIFDRIRDLLNDEIQRRNPNLEELKIPESISKVALLLNNIGANSDLREFENLKEFGPEEENKSKEIVKQIEEANRKDPSQLISKKRQQGKDIKHIINEIRSLNNLITVEIIQDIKNKIKNIRDLRKIATAISASQFKNEPIQLVGTKTWRTLIEAAIAYNQEVFPGASFPANVPEARCLLCHQLLQEDAKKRLEKFFAFVRSDTEQKINNAVKELKTLKNALEVANLDFFSDTSTGYRTVTDCRKTVAENLVQNINEMKQLHEKLINNIEREEWSQISKTVSISEYGLKDIRNRLAQELISLKKQDISNYKKELSQELQILHDRKHLNLNFVKVKEAVKNLKWIQKAQSVKKTLSHRHVTDKQKALTSDLIAKGFIEKFRKECENLDYTLPLDIKITGTDAVTHRKLSIGKIGKQMPDPSEVLSEGEQTAVALADFLAEISLNNRPLGIIFDDPVNSLDHLRKEKIANRLVKEASNRQVIVFTHDILFTHYLAEATEKAGPEKVKFSACTISVDPNNSMPGYVNKTVFPHIHYEKESEKQASIYLEQAKQLSGIDQKEKLELGCGALRAAYEDFIQRQLFSDVVARWREPIKATALSRIYFDEKTIKDVVTHYELLSRYEKGHSHTAEFHEKPLDCNFLENELKAFREIAKQYNSAKTKFIEQKSKEKKSVFI